MWYYKDGETEVGPVTKDDLKQLLKDKKIGGNTLLRSVKGKNWRPLKDMVKKKPIKNPPSQPPLQQKEPPDTPEKESRITTDTPPPISPLPKEKQEMPPGPGTAGDRKNLPFTFTGNGSEYFKIWIVNIVLSVLTLGIYSAWAKVRRKQYFYGNTRVNDTSFNYLANPVTILKGRVIVFIGFVIYSTINNFFPSIGPLILLLMLPLLPWFVIKALSFNARNSAIQNIRFTFNGTYWDAFKVYILWPILLPFTLGLIYPYLLYRQKKFLIENSTYGTTPFAFHAVPKDYYRIFLGLLIPFILVVVIGIVVQFAIPFISILIFLVFYLYVFAYVGVKSSNLLYNSSSFAEHGFSSTMEVMEYFVIVVTNSLATAFTLGFYHPFAQVRAYRYQIEHLDLKSAGNLDQFIADEREQVSALGDEAAEFMDFDIGI